ncbi:MAG: ATP-dependent sacrificial sulfur transferase LarE [Eubacteriales bacterium]|nr:ATP-dependent sacrificial sulfur transferase LarE [Eubacteriales bacterium]
MTLETFFSEHRKVALGFSGGVDSSYLLWAALNSGAEIKAYYVSTAFQPAFEREDALRLAGALGVEPAVLELDILACSEVSENPPDRCYYCKKQIFGAVCRKARGDGFDVLLDGTNASDDAGDRPGMRALEELSVLSPLRICGLTKEEIRRRSREAGLFTWDKPAYACLATRTPAGERITARLLRRTEEAETALAALGFRDFRVRHRGDEAFVEITKEQRALLRENWDRMEAVLKEKGYRKVFLDMASR